MTETLLDRASWWPIDGAAPWPESTIGRWLDRTTRLLPIGSCFALNFTRWIRLQGVPVDLPDWGMHYNPATILNELRGAAGFATPDIRWHDETDELVCLDAMRHTVQAHSDAELTGIRDALRLRGAAWLAAADALLVTLGLSEVWEQRVGDEWVIVNRTPPASAFLPDHHRSRFLTVDEVRRYIADIVALVRTTRGEDVVIVFTVSPIPLKASFTGLDARVANARSKAVLLAGLHEAFEDGLPGVGYFPAYEMFWAAPTADLWQVDGRHPTAPAIDRACREFVREFAIEPEAFAGPVDFRVKQVSADRRH